MGEPEVLSAITRRWFERHVGAPTPIQRAGWPMIARDHHSLLIAPTGSGKTLAAFLVALDRLLAGERGAPPAAGVNVLYVSPLKALVHDVDRNLRAPLEGLTAAFAEHAGDRPRIDVDVRTGDTSAAHRRRQATRPPHVLATTPESLFLVLGSRAREMLREVRTVIVDEIHALAGDKRGAHLALSLERLEELTGRPPQRIGLSATVAPAREVAQFLAGSERAAHVVDRSAPPALDLEVVFPPSARSEPGGVSAAATDTDPDSEAEGAAGASAWDSIEPHLVQLIRENRQTIVFVNSRSLCERLAQRIDDRAGEHLVRPHHGSISRRARAETEAALKAGALRGIVATSSLELGIDMGAVDRVVLLESPGSVARGLQRAGRAGHHVGAPSAATMIPKHRGELLECAAVARGMIAGDIEPLSIPRHPLDALAQQVVALCVDAPRTPAAIARIVRRAYPYRELGDAPLSRVLDMLAGAYPAPELAELAPRLRWDRARDELSARRGAALFTRLSPGTIPDRGLYPVFSAEGGRQLGELDEEMVFESKPGDVFALGASTWRIDDIGRDRVIASPAPGEAAKLPFWRGEGGGRPTPLGRAIGQLAREIAATPPTEAEAFLRERCAMDAPAARELAALAGEQMQRAALPSDRELVFERFRDELGDWRVCLLTPFGARVHAPWALAIGAAGRGGRLRVLHTDDGISFRAPGEGPPPRASELVFEPNRALDLVRRSLIDSPLFAGRFRENAARALLIPRRGAGKRTPLWQQRQRAAQILAAVRDHRDFPIVLETYRQCMEDVFDLEALAEVLGGAARGEIRVTEVETGSPSPLARSLAFAYEAAYLYEQDAPLAERRAQALAVDPELLRELLGEAEIRDVVDPRAIAAISAELEGRAEGFGTRDADDLEDGLRLAGELTEDEISARAGSGERAQELAQELVREGRALRIALAGRERLVSADLAPRYRALAEHPSGAPLTEAIARFARARGPFVPTQVGDRFGASEGDVAAALDELTRAGTLVRGAIREESSESDVCHAEVLRRIKRRSRELLRGDLAPADAPAFARFLAAWQGVAPGERSASGDPDKVPGAPGDEDEALARAVDALEGLYLPRDVLFGTALPARVPGSVTNALERAAQGGALVWLGAPGERVALYSRERAGLLLSPEPEHEPDAPTPAQRAIRDHLETRGASFLADIDAAARASEPGIEPSEIDRALWDLIFSGLVASDSFAPLFRPLRAAKPSGRGRGLRRAAPLAGGRFFATSELRRPAATGTERARALAEAMLSRYGIASPQVAAAESVPGGFGSVYAVLRAMEARGALRRGHFVESFSGAQFAQPDALDALRAEAKNSAEAGVCALAAADPAQPYGALLPWPAPVAEQDAGLRRVPGAWVILDAGRPALFVAPGAKRLWTFRDAPLTGDALTALADLPTRGRGPPVIEEIDGAPVTRSPWWDRLLGAGFVRHYRGLTTRR